MEKTPYFLKDCKIFPIIICTSVGNVRIKKEFRNELHLLFGEAFKGEEEFFFVTSLLRMDYEKDKEKASVYECKMSLAGQDQPPILSYEVFDPLDKEEIIDFMSLPHRIFETFEKKILLFSGSEMDNIQIERAIKEWNKPILN